MKKIKIEIKNRITGKVLFSCESENNSVKKILARAVKEDAYLQGADLRGADLQDAYLQDAYLQGAYLRGADLRGAYLQGAYLQGADLRGAYLQGIKIKNMCTLTGLYKYVVIPFISEKNVEYIKMGCYTRKLVEWENDFWNNDKEFPNNDSIDSRMRVFAFETAKKWLKMIEKAEL